MNPKFCLRQMMYIILIRHSSRYLSSVVREISAKRWLVLIQVKFRSLWKSGVSRNDHRRTCRTGCFHRIGKSSLLPDILWQQELFFSPIILLQMLLFCFYGCTILKGSTYSPSTLKREIQMISGGTSVGSDIRDNLSLLHMIAFFDSQCGTMQIHRLYTVSMVDGDIISKA